MNNLDKQYQLLLQDILDNGIEKNDRTGTGTISVFGRQIRHKMSEGFPLLTTKKMAIKSIMTELKWFLKGDTNIKYLLENNCHIWTGDAIKNYEKHYGEINGGPHITKEEYFEDLILTNDEFAKTWGELGPVYGKQWRNWDTLKFVEGENEFTVGVWKREQIDQIQNLIEELKRNPDSRRLMVSAWNVGEMDEMVLPPCHYGFQVYTRELSKFERSRWWGLPKGEHFLDEVLDKYNIPKRAISLSWNQRSVDTFLGLPFNIAFYAMLLTLIAKEVNMVPEEIIGNLGDTHLYLNHVQQAKEQLSRDPKPYLPEVKVSNVNILNGEFDYDILHYHSHPAIKAPLSN
jgi:thymidylate synthase